jgi:vanillate O-demethylase monooxygenase subunit
MHAIVRFTLLNKNEETTVAFLRNTWYCAGWAEEIDNGEQLGRQILGEHIMLYRKQDGTPVAIGNRCPHRFAPLNDGPRYGDVIACPYHGLQFNSEGECVKNPNEGGVIPKACKVPAYPLVERWDALFIWMGDPEKADPDLIPDYSMTITREGWSSVRGFHITEGNYELVVDNLMDRTHVQFMHPLLQFSTPEGENFERVQSVKQDGNIIWDLHEEFYTPHYRMLDVLWPNAPDDIVNHLDVRWQPPSNMLLDAGTTKIGTDRKVGVSTMGANMITPIDENRTYYFWNIARNNNLDDPTADEKVKQMTANTFKNEDGAMIAKINDMMGEHSADMMQLSPVLLPTDAGAVRARRILAKLIAEEQEAASA